MTFNVFLPALVLSYIVPTLQSLCAQNYHCEAIIQRDYCTQRGAIAEGQDKPACPVMEVELGNPKFNLVYLHCCDTDHNITSRQWYFTQDLNNKTWTPLKRTTETISYKKIRKYRLGYYRCITKNATKTITDKTIQVVSKDCRPNNRTEVRSPRNISVSVGQHDASFNYVVHFGCEATARNVSITFYKDGTLMETSSVARVSIQGCVSSRSVPRSCGTISFPVVTQADLGMVVSITATACYNGTMQYVAGNVSILNEMQYRRVSGSDNTVASIMIGGLVLAATICLILLFLCICWSKLYVRVLSEMSCLMRISGNNKTIGSAKQVFIIHSDDDTRLAWNLREWITRTYVSRVVCSYDLEAGRGVVTGEIDDIKKSDVVFFIPNYLTDTVNENVFNIVVEHKACFRITILEKNTSQKMSCSLSKNKIFKRLKHIYLKSGSYQDIDCSELRKRLPSCSFRRQRSVGSAIGHSSRANRRSCDLEGYQPGYLTQDDCTYSWPSSSTIFEGPSDMTSPVADSNALSVINSQQSKKWFYPNLKLTVPTGSHCLEEVQSPCATESPNTATTFLSPDLQYNTIPFDNIDHQ